MDVHLAEERMLVLQDQFNMDHAEGRASTKKIDAFGALAKVAGFLSRPKDDEFELVYREHRLQPFWRAACTFVSAYERKRDHVLKLPPEVRQVALAGETHPVVDHAVTLSVLETCREEIKRDIYFDALTGQPVADLSAKLRFPTLPATEESLAAFTEKGTVVVPPQATSSVVVRDVLGGLVNKIKADKVLEETVSFEAIDLYYRPVYAFRYRRAGKEAVVEFDGLTGEVRTGGATFESYVGKILDTHFLLDAGAEVANLFLPGATLVKVLVAKGLDLRGSR
jgi:hypothetical protein